LRLRRLLWGAMALALVLVAMAALVERWRRPATAPPRLARLPDFTLRNRDGRAIGRGDLEGRPWIADLVFTRCGGSCPLISARMARLDRELPGPSSLRLVSFSVDPDFDTPQVLARYANSFAASPRWLFLTGSREQILRLSRQGFKLAIDAGGPAREPILHSTRFILIDGQGWIRRYYDAFDNASMARLPRDLAAVLAER
jgi:protein SCO1/2